MDMSSFTVIGENIHCTRIVKLGGKHTVELPGGGHGLAFRYRDEDRILRVPPDWGERSPAFGSGKVKHVALAIHQALNGSGEDCTAGQDYLAYAAERQIDAGAGYLDVNVDEYSNDPAERGQTMRWLAEFLCARYDVPLSIDSSSAETMADGLEASRKEAVLPMVNSVSLERVEYVDLIRDFDASAVVSAAGKKDLPTDVDGRLANFEQIVGLLEAAGVGRDRMHLDPLVFPISTEPMHGRNFLAATAEAKRRFEGAHLCGGFSNVSFGMPQRKLLNMVFVYLAIEAGASSGIIDPTSMPLEAIAAMDRTSEPFRLAEAFLTGEDMYGMEFIAAHRAGKLD
ncbi:MAG TPA: dihydropteroate synthase [Phycisphaerae bacterium]|nr:dihydropteroate synthase [Phycisphaerae bacterium]